MNSTANEKADSLDVLGVFGKFWQAGQVKTRLAQSIGGESAAAVYRASLLATLERLGHLADRRVLAFAPTDRRNDFAALKAVAGGNWTLAPQTDGDLGERMAAFFADQFRQRADRVVLLGSDSPTVPLGHVSAAFDLLGECDVVIGPSCDGGYYLVGQSSLRAEMFAGIVWSSEQVWQQTRAQLEAHNATYAVLPEWYDVDTVDDVYRLADELDRQDELGRACTYLCETMKAALAEHSRRA